MSQKIILSFFFVNNLVIFAEFLYLFIVTIVHIFPTVFFFVARKLFEALIMISGDRARAVKVIAAMPGEEDLAAAYSTDGAGTQEKPVRQFTWRELSKLNGRHNAHVAYRGKVTG